jgi:hypothetical protein
MKYLLLQVAESGSDLVEQSVHINPVLQFALFF